MDKYDKLIDDLIDYINYKLKREKDMSVRQLAETLHIPSSSLHARLQKERKMEVKTLLLLVDYFDISLDAFLYAKNEINYSCDVDNVTISIKIRNGNKEKQHKLLELLENITNV